MQSVQIQTTIRRPQADHPWVNPYRLRSHLGAVWAAIRGRRQCQDNVPYYGGHAWCDSMEQQLIDNVTTFRRPEF